MAVPSWFDFLRLEAELALTYIESARVHIDPANSIGALRNARKALDQIKLCLTQPAAYGLSDEEIAFLEQRQAVIESQLIEF
jgi:hypothetical protein